MAKRNQSSFNFAAHGCRGSPWAIGSDDDTARLESVAHILERLGYVNYEKTKNVKPTDFEEDVQTFGEQNAQKKPDEQTAYARWDQVVNGMLQPTGCVSGETPESGHGEAANGILS